LGAVVTVVVVVVEEVAVVVVVDVIVVVVDVVRVVVVVHASIVLSKNLYLLSPKVVADSAPADELAADRMQSLPSPLYAYALQATACMQAPPHASRDPPREPPSS